MARVRKDVLDILGLGAPVTAGEIAGLADRTAELRRLLRDREPRDAWADAVRELESPLLQARGRAVSESHTFARTVTYLLDRHGPMSTAEIHPLVQSLHPDLCDDTVERIIDGVHFGKRWKHMVRNAQQNLKSRGRIRLEEGRWFLRPR